MLKVSKKEEAEIADRFEAALDSMPIFDKLPFFVKREAAEEVARIAVTKLCNFTSTR